MKLAVLIGTICFTAFLASDASPVYPIYADYAPPLVLPGAYAPGQYPLPAGGAYFGASGQQHSEGGRYSGQESGGYSEKAIEYQKDSKYYYGGQYKGSCLEDGLYYKDDTTFVMCSNGYPHEQPCPPGTKTSGSPAYKPGYYYGYTDLCSVNLVDYGLGPEHYAPAGPPEYEKSDSRAVSSSKKVSYSNTGYNNGPHHGEKHASKDVFRQQDTVGQYGQRDHQQQHTHVEKHKVQGGYGGYDKQVVKQGVVSTYNSEHAGRAPNHAVSHYDAAAHAPYDGAVPISTNQESFHKEKQQTIVHDGNHHHATRQLHHHSVTSHAGGQHHHAAGSNVDLRGGSNYPSSEGFDLYHGSSASNHGPVVDKVQSSSTVYHAASGGPGVAGGYQGASYNQFDGYGYPQLGQGHQAGRPYEY